MQTDRSAETIHVVQRMAPGGIETLVLDLVRAGDGSDMIVSLEDRAEDLVAQWPALSVFGDRFISLQRASGLRPDLMMQLYRLFRAHKPKAVFAHHIGPWVYGGPAARLARVPGVVHVEHDVWHYEAPRRKRLAQAMELAVRPRHVAVSESIKTQMEALLPRPRVTVIPNGVDLDRFCPRDPAAARNRLGLAANGRFIGTAGRLVAVKAQADLISALRYLPDDVRAVLVGDGVERAALEAHAAKIGVADRTVFLGHRDDLHEVLPAFDVFCLPSLNEGLPRSVIEAQACGVPVVASDVGGMRQAVCPQTGRFVSPSAPEELGAALDAALASPPQISPRTFVAEHFSFADTVRAYRRIAGLAA